MNSNILSVVFVIIALPIAACSSTNMYIESDHDQEAAFSDLVSYELIESANPYEDRGALGFDSDIMARRIQNMLYAGFDSLGYLHNESYEEPGPDQPDFEVSYRMLASEEVEHIRNAQPVGHYSSHGRHGRYGRSGGYGGAGASSFALDVVQCVLMIDVWDVETDQLVWRGWARWQMSEHPGSEEVTQNLKIAVVEILSEFPANKYRALGAL